MWIHKTTCRISVCFNTEYTQFNKANSVLINLVEKLDGNHHFVVDFCDETKQINVCYTNMFFSAN